MSLPTLGHDSYEDMVLTYSGAWSLLTQDPCPYLLWAMILTGTWFLPILVLVLTYSGPMSLPALGHNSYGDMVLAYSEPGPYLFRAYVLTYSGP